MAEDTIYLKQFINLYNKCKPVEDLKLTNEESLIYRLKTNGDSIRMGSTKKLLKYIPDKESMYSFWRKNKYFWIIPLETTEHNVYGYMLRGVKDKNYSVFKLDESPSVLFGLYDLEDFNINRDYIILTEGVKDCLVMKQIYKYVLSVNTAGITNKSYNILRALTNKFILIYDNDEAGSEAIFKDINKLSEEGCIVHKVSLRFKDPGKYINHPNELQILNSNIQQLLKGSTTNVTHKRRIPKKSR